MQEKKGFYLYILKNKLAIILIITLLTSVGYKVSTTIPQGVLPNIFFPRIEVSIDNGHAPISQMLYSVTKPSEEALKSVQDVQKIVSSTSVGTTDINIYFNWSIDPYLAYQLVQARMADIKNSISPNAKITIKQATPSMYPVSIYAIGSDSVSRARLTEKLYYELKPVMLGIDGVYDIQMKSPAWSEYKLILDGKKVAAYKLNIDDIITQLKAQNSIDFLGLINDKHTQYILSLNQKRTNANDFLKLNISLGNGKSIKLSDIALLIERENPVKEISAVSGFKNAVVFDLLRQPNANAIDVQKAFNKKVDALNKKLAKDGIKLKKYYDGTVFIKKAVRSVVDAIVIGSFIAVLIIFFFLRKFTLSLAALFIIPVTFFITIIGMKLIGIDFNIFSLGGMVAAMGGLIDQMLIVVENIERHYENGETKRNAIIKGSGEILPIMSVATTISVLIFVPLLLVSGIVGVFFKQLAIVLVITYFISQLIAIFLTPVIAYIMLPKEQNKNEDFMQKYIDKYINFMRKSFKHSWVSIPLIIAFLATSAVLYLHIPSAFLPQWDEGNIVVDLVLPTEITLNQSQEEFDEIGMILSKIPEVKNWTMRIGTGLGKLNIPINQGDFLVTLKANHKRSSFEVIDDIRKKIEAQIPNIVELGLSQVLEDRLGDIMGADAPISVHLFGSNPEELITQGYKLQKVLRKIKDVEEVNVLTSYASPAINIKAKSIARSRYGIDEAMIRSQISALYYGKIVASVANGEKLINLRVLMSRPNIDPIAYLKKDLKIYSPTLKQRIPLKELADISYENKVAEVSHYNLSPVCVLGIRFTGNDMSGVVAKIKKEMNNAKIPDNITTEISGFYKEQQKSFKQMSLVILFAVTIIFIGLLLNFSSLRIAVAIVTALILTSTGVFLALYLTHKPLDIMAFMGVLIVLSIVINNNVLIYDFFQMNLNHQTCEIEQQLDALALRAKPILMTMVSNALALLPIALAIGTGTQIIQDLAISIMGGLLFAIVINLYIIPLFFHFIRIR
ncbi:efflux RND transporter permease subunit [Sulfurimonas autotrophica]|uniref:Acriflavin resistance protein n=1 Tax=Sulfurimonas autotrophica (strain ATCC BAA-671 / DSM 16294 / JCM 11897 / OK10) TaxID=563040 RepID=E0UPS0_SULAO|nr:efflux RND transporter permease subunit [Sulfurimonas autotrophica]ADN09729.1 acriflavin resistance protein [Sulfurimonas autotrophica DSM 16294]